MPSVAKWTRKTVYAKSSDCDCNLDSEQDVEEEVLDLWMRDALVLIQELLEDPNFKNEMHHRPMHLYTDESWEERIFGEMWTADWWLEKQKELPPCSAVVPFSIASDKTLLSAFHNKSTYLVYLTIGNIPRYIRRKPNEKATILLAYLLYVLILILMSSCYYIFQP